MYNFTLNYDQTQRIAGKPFFIHHFFTSTFFVDEIYGKNRIAKKKMFWKNW